MFRVSGYAYCNGFGLKNLHVRELACWVWAAGRGEPDPLQRKPGRGVRDQG